MILKVTSAWKHWEYLEFGTGVCGKGLHDGEIEAPEVFDECPEYNGPDRGLGDKVSRIIKKATNGRLKPCGGCAKRRHLLNKLKRND